MQKKLPDLAAEIMNTLRADVEAGVSLPAYASYHEDDETTRLEDLLRYLIDRFCDKPKAAALPIGAGTIKVVEFNSPGGDGAEMSVVLEYKLNGATYLLQAVGYHSSYDEDTWEDALTPVEPYEVTVTRYRPTHQRFTV